MQKRSKCHHPQEHAGNAAEEFNTKATYTARYADRN